MSVPESYTEAITASTQIGLALIGQWIRQNRWNAHLTQSALGRRAMVHQTTISRLETGRLRSLRLIRLAAIVAALSGVAVDERVDVLLQGNVPWEAPPLLDP